MNIQAFPVAVTNIFPMANSTRGGQLATEFNMRSRESVGTASEIEYMVGPTYLHSERDFVVSKAPDSNSKLIISPGRGIINGHYVETLSDIEVDLAAANASSEDEHLSGQLVIGIRMMYSDTELSGSTVPLSAFSGSLLPEDNLTQFYKGVQIVILPPSQFKLPEDVPTNENAVTAHLKLATFKYMNGSIRGNIELTPFSEHSSVISASRIANIDEELNTRYISSEGLQPNRIYTFAGKPVVDDQGHVVTTGEDTWCDSTDSLMVWDNGPQSGLASEVNSSPYGQVSEANFIWNASASKLDLVIPHKQIDGGMIHEDDPSHRYKYYPKVLSVPAADYSDKSSYGLVSPQYTAGIDKKFNEISSRYFALYGTGQIQRGYLPTIKSTDELPYIQAQWNMYDFVVVGQDYTQVGESDSTHSPATIYQIIAGLIPITSLSQLSTPPSYYLSASAQNEIATITLPYTLDDIQYIDQYNTEINTELAAIAPQGTVNDFVRVHFSAETPYQEQLFNDTVVCPSTSPFYATISVLNPSRNPEKCEVISNDGSYVARLTWSASSNAFIGTNTNTGYQYVLDWGTLYSPNKYFKVYDNLGQLLETGYTTQLTINYTNRDPSDVYYLVASNNAFPKTYSDAIWLTYEIQLATEESVGGFKNVSEGAVGSGYVYMDPEGHLRVLDYEKLVSGTLAYQLGHDLTFTSLTLEELQTQLDEYVNNRVAFPDATQITNAYTSAASGITVDPNVINLTIELPAENEAKTLYITDIDSRFNSSVYLHITGQATSTTTVSISNCEKLRIDNNIAGTPNIVLENCNLYYDATIINDATSIVGLSLWYEVDRTLYDSVEVQQVAPQIYVDGMTVYQKNVPIVAQDIDVFSEDGANDLHYELGLDSITLDSYGDVIGAGIKIADDITSNNSDVPSFVVAKFDFPQGGQLVYPYKHMTKPIKISGEFMTSYEASAEDSEYTHHLHKTTFTLVTLPYDAESQQMEDAQAVPCVLSVDTEIKYRNPVMYEYESTVSVPSEIPGLESGNPYVFTGKVNQ